MHNTFKKSIWIVWLTSLYSHFNPLLLLSDGLIKLQPTKYGWKRRKFIEILMTHELCVCGSFYSLHIHFYNSISHYYNKFQYFSSIHPLWVEFTGHVMGFIVPSTFFLLRKFSHNSVCLLCIIFDIFTIHRMACHVRLK